MGDVMEIHLSRRGLVAAAGGLGAAALAPRLAFGQAPASGAVRFDPAFVDAEAERFRAAFDIPGLAVAVIGATPEPYLSGYGVRTLGRPERVDVHTRFAIA